MTRSLACLGMPYETAVHQWADGARRLEQAGPGERPALERVSERIEDELRRRLGGPFTTDELAELYDGGTSWCTEIAMEAAPSDPGAWDARVVADAAFARYLREATDYAGGRRLRA